MTQASHLRRVLITGAASGIGRDLVQFLATQEFEVWAGVRQKRDLDLWTGQTKIKPILLDVTNAEDVTRVAHALQASGGGLNLLINNAGYAQPGPWELLDERQLRQQFEVNFFGVTALTRACLPALRKKNGRIVLISSISGKLASPYLGAYAASKFALEAFADSLRREVAEQGVQVALINPGPVKSKIWEKGLALGEQFLTHANSPFLPLYQKQLERFQKFMMSSAEQADSTKVVEAALKKIIRAKRVRPRYFVGRGVFLSSLLIRMLPDRWLDILLKIRFQKRSTRI